MPWTELAPMLVAAGGIITAYAAWVKVRHGEGNKRIDASMKEKELTLLADRQDNDQFMSLVSFQQVMLDKHQTRLDELQAALESKAEREAENRAELRLLSYKISECEEDRLKLRTRILRLEDDSDMDSPPQDNKPG